ncbi:hypothetical protein NS365_05320 [Aureimonas ureilytica]|uniref:HTH lysR-type domain-containing protein n=1 Tax=Aureimonas ureilytica TaxID=401562 RepID=A0A175RVR4_9HYPH|nr:LysR substrate-binding domain-containing protein [Aureimonas ureilytica]KTR07064.1 hypothetical protein NS365_05320 [Aureimonas ureilytica]
MPRKLPPLSAALAFEATVRLGTTVAAAAEIGVTHGAVSRRIGQLEAWLGRPLFRREGGRLVPNDEGVAYADMLARTFDLIEKGTRSVADEGERVVRVNTTASFAAEWLLPRLARFRSTHPDVEVWVDETKNHVDPRSGGCDVAIRMGSRPQPAGGAEALITDRLVPVCTPEMARQLVRPADLQDVPLLHDLDPAAQWSRWASLFCPTDGPPDDRLGRGQRFASSSLLLQAAASGQGVALVHERLAERWIGDGRLVQPFSEAVDLGEAHWIVVRSTDTHRRPLRRFLIWLREEAGRPVGERQLSPMLV